MDFMGISGLVLSIVGLWLAIWQLRRTQVASEAARDAALEAVRGIARIYAITSIQEIAGRSRLLLSLVKARQLPSSASAAFELRDAVSKYQVPTEEAADKASWLLLTSEIEAIHERLESAVITNRFGADEREALVHKVAGLHTQISARASRLTAPGASHANT